MARATSSKRPRPDPDPDDDDDERELDADTGDTSYEPLPGETQFSPHSSDAPDGFFAAERILAEKRGQYLVQWKGIDPDTQRKWVPTWEPKGNCTPALIKEWKAMQKRKEREEDRRSNDYYGKPNSRPSSRASLAPTAKTTNTRTTRASDTTKPTSRASVAQTTATTSNKSIPSKRSLTNEKADQLRSAKRQRKGTPSDDEDEDMEDADANDDDDDDVRRPRTRATKAIKANPTRLSRTASTSTTKQSARGSSKPRGRQPTPGRGRGRPSGGNKVDAPIVLSSGSEHENGEGDAMDDEDDDLRPRLGGLPQAPAQTSASKARPPQSSSSAAKAPQTARKTVSSGTSSRPSAPTSRASHRSQRPKSMDVDVDSDDASVVQVVEAGGDDEVAEEEPGGEQEQDSTSSLRQRVNHRRSLERVDMQKKRPRPSAVSDAGRQAKKRRVGDSAEAEAEGSRTASTSKSKSKSNSASLSPVQLQIVLTPPKPRRALPTNGHDNGKGKGKEKEIVPDSQSQSVTYTTTPSQPSRHARAPSQEFTIPPTPSPPRSPSRSPSPPPPAETTTSTSRRRPLGAMRDQITPTKFIRRRGMLDDDDGDDDVSLVIELPARAPAQAQAQTQPPETQIETFSSPSQPRRAAVAQPRPLFMTAVREEDKPVSTSTTTTVVAAVGLAAVGDDGWAAQGWQGGGDDDDDAAAFGNGDVDADIAFVDVDAGQAAAGEKLVRDETGDVDGLDARNVDDLGAEGGMDRLEKDAMMQEAEVVDEVLHAMRDDDDADAAAAAAVTIAVEKEDGVTLDDELMDDGDEVENEVVVVREEITVLVPGSTPAVPEDLSELELPVFDDQAPDVEAALELVKNREKELEVVRAERQAANVRRDALQRAYDELVKDRDSYKARCDFLSSELWKSQPTEEAPAGPGTNEAEPAQGHVPVEATATQETAATFSGTNTNSTQEELETLRTELDRVAAERNQHKADVELAQGTTARLRAELDGQKAEVTRLLQEKAADVERLQAQTAEVEQLQAQISALTKRDEGNQEEAAFLRLVYSEASSAAAEYKKELDELSAQNTVLRGQATAGVAAAKLFAQARVGVLEKEVARWKAAAALQLARADRSELVGIRERAAREPVLQKRVRELKEQVDELEEENEELERQVRQARAERLPARAERRAEEGDGGMDDGLAGFAPDELVFRCEWWETLGRRCRAVYRTKGEMWDHILSSDHIADD